MCPRYPHRMEIFWFTPLWADEGYWLCHRPVHRSHDWPRRSGQVDHTRAGQVHLQKGRGGGSDESGAIKADKEKEILLALSKISPTVGLNIGRLEIRGANVIIWDLGGDAGLRGIWDKYYADAHAVRRPHLLRRIFRVRAPGRNRSVAPHTFLEIAAACSATLPRSSLVFALAREANRHSGESRVLKTWPPKRKIKYYGWSMALGL